MLLLHRSLRFRLESCIRMTDEEVNSSRRIVPVMAETRSKTPLRECSYPSRARYFCTIRPAADGIRVICRFHVFKSLRTGRWPLRSLITEVNEDLKVVLTMSDWRIGSRGGEPW